MKKIDQLVDDFAEAVAMQSKCIKDGDHKAGNRQAQRYIGAFRALAEVGDEGRDALADLLDDERVEVRVMAASFLLRHRHAQARQVLEEAANGQGLSAFAAQESLKRWEEGEWSLDAG